MGYVLFIVLQVNGATAVHSLEFQTAQLCETARAEITQMFSAGAVKATCLQNVPSGSRRQ